MNNTNEQVSAYGTKPLKRYTYFIYGMGNFASQLSWTMVGTYLSLFYTDVYGLGVGAVAILMLVARVLDGINGPIMGTVMERTHTRWGRFRPYIFVGAPLLVLFTILTFTVPGFMGPAKLAYAYITYIGLGVSYTITNVPYLAMPLVMTRNPNEINRLNAAQMMGMTVGQIILNLVVLQLVLWFGHGNQASGYQATATLLALIALPIFWAVAGNCKEQVVVKKEQQGTVKEGLKLVFKNRNLLCAIFYTIFNMTGMLGRIAVSVYYYLYDVKNFTMVTVFMMMQMIVGTLVMPFSPKICAKLGKRNTAILSMLIQGGSLVILFLGPWTNSVFVFIMLVVYGLGYIAGPAGSGMVIDSIDDFDDKYGKRNDGMAFSFSNLASTIGSALGNALFLAIIGWFGYYGGCTMTPNIQNGINISVNLLPAIVYFLGIIPLALYQLDKPGYMEGVRARLLARRKATEQAEQESEKVQEAAPETNE